MQDSLPPPPPPPSANFVDLVLVIVGLLVIFFLCWKFWRPFLSLLKWSCIAGVLILFVSLGVAIIYPDGFSLLYWFAGKHNHHLAESVAINLVRSILYDVATNLPKAYLNARGTYNTTATTTQPQKPTAVT